MDKIRAGNIKLHRDMGLAPADDHRTGIPDGFEIRNYLVEFLADVENGIKKDEAQIKRAYEVYDHYKQDLNGNSYIGDKWERLMK